MTRDPSAQRDATLRLVRRLRVGLVSAGVAGSLGVAGVVATHAPNATSGSPPLARSNRPRSVAAARAATTSPAGRTTGAGTTAAARPSTSRPSPRRPGCSRVRAEPRQHQRFLSLTGTAQGSRAGLQESSTGSRSIVESPPPNEDPMDQHRSPSSPSTGTAPSGVRAACAAPSSGPRRPRRSASPRCSASAPWATGRRARPRAARQGTTQGTSSTAEHPRSTSEHDGTEPVGRQRLGHATTSGS